MPIDFKSEDYLKAQEPIHQRIYQRLAEQFNKGSYDIKTGHTDSSKEPVLITIAEDTFEKTLFILSHIETILNVSGSELKALCKHPIRIVYASNHWNLIEEYSKTKNIELLEQAQHCLNIVDWFLASSPDQERSYGGHVIIFLEECQASKQSHVLVYSSAPDAANERIAQFTGSDYELASEHPSLPFEKILDRNAIAINYKSSYPHEIGEFVYRALKYLNSSMLKS